MWLIKSGGLFRCCMEHLVSGLETGGSLCHIEVKRTDCPTCGTTMIRDFRTWQWKGTT